MQYVPGSREYGSGFLAATPRMTQRQHHQFAGVLRAGPDLYRVKTNILLKTMRVPDAPQGYPQRGCSAQAAQRAAAQELLDTKKQHTEAIAKAFERGVALAEVLPRCFIFVAFSMLQSKSVQTVYN